MKKFFYLLLVTVFCTLILSSCGVFKRGSRPCPAYDNVKYYQIERPF